MSRGAPTAVRMRHMRRQVWRESYAARTSGAVGRPSARRALVAALLLLSWLARSAGAYNEDGHFYTTVAVEHARTPPFQRGELPLSKAVLMGFCAQLPDLSNDL